MISIQDAGREILGNTPRNFYVFTGSEYGIKESYLNKLEQFYSRRIVADSASDLLRSFHIKKLVPEPNSLYVVRYDDEFISSLDEKTSNYVATAKIPGTVVCIYESPKHAKKVEKYLAGYTVCIDTIDSRFISKYLHSEFPKLPDFVLDFISKHAQNYGHARNVASSLRMLDRDIVADLTDKELRLLCSYSEKNDSIVSAITRRDLHYLLTTAYEQEDPSNVVYSFLSASLDIEKTLSGPNRGNYKTWTLEDAYNLFVHSYNIMKKIRTLSCDPKNCVVYLVSLLAFVRVPQCAEG